MTLYICNDRMNILAASGRCIKESQLFINRILPLLLLKIFKVFITRLSKKESPLILVAGLFDLLNRFTKAIYLASHGIQYIHIYGNLYSLELLGNGALLI